MLVALRGHGGIIESVEHARDDANVAVTSATDSTCRLWDVRAGRAVRCVARVEGITHARLHGHALYASSQSGCVMRLDTRFDAIVRDGRSVTVWNAQAGAEVANQVDVSSDGAAVVSCDDDGHVYAFAAGTGERVACPGRKVHTSLATSVACRPDTNEVVSVGTDCALRLWTHSASPSQVLKSLVVDSAADAAGTTSQLCNPPHIHHVVCHARGRVAAAALGDGRCLLYDLKARKVARYLSGGHTYSVSHVSFPRDQTLLSVGNDKQCVLWHVDPRKCKSAELRHRWLLPGKANWVSSSDRDILLAMGDGVLVQQLPA